MEEYLGNKGCIVLVVFNHRQMNIASFKYCALTSATDGSEDLPNPAYDDRIAESPIWVILRSSSAKTGSSWDFWVGGTRILQKPDHIWSQFGKNLISPPSPASIMHLPRISASRFLSSSPKLEISAPTVANSGIYDIMPSSWQTTQVGKTQFRASSYEPGQPSLCYRRTKSRNSLSANQRPKACSAPHVLPGFSITGSNWLLHMAVLSCFVIGRVDLEEP